ncbi:hypothetical protein E4U13_007807 [Claviceps humidiphila]|uniref:DNA damage-responsive protein 48 n=2 Tax=Claviceps TaxID=5110 RepID=A0A9P7MTW7_9HYPO|nr:hypothetical protein E4U57_002295 [Claviceps arundinis]KAG5968526.1 hypothetical protein E4U56_000351 [Claviceps arundinis]KAG6101433.1 hypothetical protein E4U30_002106 [Claviceps sp. LM220 group G6]KAG6106984.1 hypothetical protein E4U31_000407 [Claviceps sp. LM219 group G6]KAG6119337.1 hypothetical protein E4U13_007807 [Claviceps humidiphila]
MDLLKKVTDGLGGGNNGDNKTEHTKTDNANSGNNQDSPGGMAALKEKLNGAAGGGQRGEQNEDGLDKAIDFVQEKFLGQGDQSNESAAEQAKDEAISDLIRDRYKTTTGKEFFIADKDKKFGL